MSLRTIPVIEIRADERYASVVPDVSGPAYGATGVLEDRFDRPLKDLRISVTDRCNFRCVYCMPKAAFGADHQFLPHAALLSFEEIERLARIFVAHGVEKIRLTGGEPLLRKDLERLVERLARLSSTDGRPLDLTLTTNGSLLVRKARALKDAGLTRVTVSLDALDDVLFKRMNDMDFPVSRVLDGIVAAQAAGLTPIKVNMVVKRGMNEHQILPMARHFKGSGVILRFIEYMDVGASNGWNMTDVVPSGEVIAAIRRELPLEPLGHSSPGETAQRWRYADGSGEIGVISSVTGAFCGACTRARLSTEGKVYLCLFASKGYDLRALLRGGASDSELTTAIARTWHQRTDRYSVLRSAGGIVGERRDDPVSHTRDALESARNSTPRVEMSYIGG
jgi:cyclic pyranopterin phosphate synthase